MTKREAIAKGAGALGRNTDARGTTLGTLRALENMARSGYASIVDLKGEKMDRDRGDNKYSG